ncbi:MAG: phosphopantetheine-binding protein, partial [Luteibacter sp.]
VPAAFVGLEALPLSPNGKLERSALPVPGEHREGFQATHVSARNDLERRLCEIWQNVLGQPDVGIEDNFFDMGGNSLQIMRAIFQARKRGLVLSAAQFFQYPTVSSLASAIVGASPPASGNDHDASAAEGHHAMCASDEVTLVEFEAGADMTEMHFRHLLKRLHGHHPQLSTMRGKGISDRDILRSMSWRNEHDPDDETMATASLEMRKRVASSGRTPFLAALAYDDDLKIVLAVHPDIVGMPDWNSILKTIATYCATGYRIGYHMKNQRDNEHV